MKGELTDREWNVILSILRYRLNFERRRKPRLDFDGKDVQPERIRELTSIMEKLEEMRLAV